MYELESYGCYLNKTLSLVPKEILTFWFAGNPTAWREAWFKKDPQFDAEIKSRFETWLEPAKNGHLKDWQATPEGALALTILLDQFPRNIYRGMPQSFAYDPFALQSAESALGRGLDQQMTTAQRMFLYLPFEHAEDLEKQNRSVDLCRQLPEDQSGLKAHTLQYALLHHDIIKRFGRFPHRNAILGRASTPEEIAFLQEPHSSF